MNRAEATFCGSCGTTLSAKRPRSWISIRLLILLSLILATMISCTVLAFSPAAQQTGLIGQFLSGFSGHRTVATHDSIVQGMQGMSQLVSAKYTIQTIVEVADTGVLGPLTTDRIWLRANADVLAGIDMSRIQPAQVEVNGEEVTITLPPPVLVSNDITYQVYDRRRGWFAAANKDLQTVAEEQARGEIVETACEKGILKEAQTNAETTLRSMLLNLGFKQVTFVATAPSGDLCKR